MDQIARTPKDVGVALRNARKAQKLTQQELGERSGLWARTISLIETDASGTKLDTIFDLCAALGLELHITPRGKSRPADLEDIF